MIEEIKKLLGHASVYSLGNILNKAVGFLLIPFYTHYLSTADYGTLELLDLSTALVALSLNMWMNASLLRYYHEFDDPQSRKSLVATALLSTAGVAAMAALAGIVLAKPLCSLILKSPIHYKLIWLISCNLFLTCLNSVSWSYLRAQQRSRQIVILNAVTLAFMLMLNIYFLTVLRTGFVGILYSSVISNLCITTGLTLYTLIQVGITFDARKLRALAAFGLPLIVTSLAAFELNFADRFFLEHYSTVSMVGLYALGYKFGFMLSFLIVQPFILIWGVRMYEVAKRRDSGEALARIAAYFTLLLTTAGLILSLVIRDVIGTFAAPRFFAAYKITPVVALAYVFYGMAYYFQTGLYIAKKTKYLGLIGVACATTNIALNFVLIPRFVAAGAAWATAASFLLMAGLAYMFSQKVYRIPYPGFRLVLPLVIAVAIYGVSLWIPAISRPASLGLRLVLIVAFALALLAFGFFDERETRQLRRAIQMTRQRLRWSAANALGD